MMNLLGACFILQQVEKGVKIDDLYVKRAEKKVAAARGELKRMGERA